MIAARRNVFAWIALLALLAMTCGSAYIPMGTFNVVVNFAVASVKALIVAFVFMQLRKDHAMVWIVAAAGLLWLAMLAGLSGADFATR
ncbi:MAG TPA: cytochrome C oxidase subunit IV family protein [Casimicrobiaceae bacterium]|jgi:cytochrome c oxidase subunit 4